MYTRKSLGSVFLWAALAQTANAFTAPKTSSKMFQTQPQYKPSKQLNMIFGGGKKTAVSNVDKEATATALDLYLKIYKNKACNKGEDVLTRTFSEMCKVYGTDNALSMVKTWPRVLNCDYQNFAPVFDIYVEKFGYDESMGMLLRNPNLLGCRPTGPNNATTAGKDQLYLSYVVAFTRPAGPYLLALLFGLLSLPGIENATGLSIRASILPTEIVNMQLPGAPGL